MAETLDEILGRCDISSADLAQRSGLAEDRVIAIATGRWTPSPNEREKLATALGVAADQIVWGHTMSPRVLRYFQRGLPEHKRKQ